MTNSNMNKDIFEIMLKNALIERYSQEVTTLKNEAEKTSVPNFFDKIVQKLTRNIKNRKHLHYCGKFIFKASIIVAASFGVIFGGLLTQPNVYAAVQEVIRSVFYDHDSYKYNNYTADKSMPYKTIFPQYVPEEYTLRYIYYADDNVTMMYNNLDDEELHFSYGKAANSQISIDNEHTLYKEIKENNFVFYFYDAIEKDEHSTLIWYQNEYYFIINAHLSEKEIVKIAKNVKGVQ